MCFCPFRVLSIIHSFALKGQSQRAYSPMASPWVIMNLGVHFALKGQKQSVYSINDY